jgi:hypothetical protein
MSSVVISGDSSGTVTLTVPSVAGTNTATLPAATGTVMVSGNMPAFSAYQNTAQTGVSSYVTTKVTLDTEVFDTNNNFASSRFTPTVAGYYQVNFTVTIPYTSSTGVILALLFKNGSNFAVGSQAAGSSGSFPPSSGGAIVYMNGSTDYLELYTYGTNNGGSYQTWNGAANTYFNGSLVRAA